MTALARTRAEVLPAVGELPVWLEQAQHALELLEEAGHSLKDFDELASYAHGQVKKLEQAREAETRELNDELERKRVPFREPLKAWNAVKTAAKDKVGQLTLEENLRKQKALAAAAVVGDNDAIATIADENNGATKTSVKGGWTHRVVDEKLVPDKYCVVVRTVNQAMIAHAIAEGVRQIPGVEIFQRADVRVKPRREP